MPDTDIGHLTMLKLPGDDFVTIELVHHPDYTPSGGESPLSHFVIQVDDMDATFAQLTAHGIDVGEPTSPDGSANFLTAMLADPDGNRIELVQWPPGHRASRQEDSVVSGRSAGRSRRSRAGAARTAGTGRRASAERR